MSYNSLYGPVPKQIDHYTHLDLSSNSLNGSLPEGLSNLNHLAGTLNLFYNQFSGEVSFSYGMFPVMVSLDLRHNNLSPERCLRWVLCLIRGHCLLCKP
ncbi:hypothetical protein LguiA_036397 [Lonicera macranthoides]